MTGRSSDADNGLLVTSRVAVDDEHEGSFHDGTRPDGSPSQCRAVVTAKGQCQEHVVAVGRSVLVHQCTHTEIDFLIWMIWGPKFAVLHWLRTYNSDPECALKG